MRQPAKGLQSDARPVSAAVVYHGAGEAIGRHVHRDAQFSVVLKGTMKVRSGRGWWIAPAGRGIWVPAGVRHSAQYSEDAAFVLLKIAPDFSTRLPLDPCTIMVSDLLRELALEISRCDACEEGDLLSRLILSRIRMAKVTPVLFLPGGRDPRLVRLMEHLQRDPGLGVSLDELAHDAGSSRRTMSRLFLADTGMSFAQWRNHLRIVTAVDLLVRGKPIMQVALTLGYQGQSSFTHMFTRIIGVPPRRYLRELEKGG